MNNSQPFLDLPNRTRALLSIKPQYAARILCGRKRYEFRRRIFSRKVDIVLIYVTGPVSRVVAEFDVLSILDEPLSRLWEKTAPHAGIDRNSFFDYFAGLSKGYAIKIGEVRKYNVPFCPIKELGLRPPQSFAYLAVP